MSWADSSKGKLEYMIDSIPQCKPWVSFPHFSTSHSRGSQSRYIIPDQTYWQQSSHLTSSENPHSWSQKQLLYILVYIDSTENLFSASCLILSLASSVSPNWREHFKISSPSKQLILYTVGSVL